MLLRHESRLGKTRFSVVAVNLRPLTVRGVAFFLEFEPAISKRFLFERCFCRRLCVRNAAVGTRIGQHSRPLAVSVDLFDGIWQPVHGDEKFASADSV